MKLRCIGCAGGYPSLTNGTTSFLVLSEDESYCLLLDAGSGSAQAVQQLIEVNELNAIVLTHDHPDHVADVGIYQHLFMLRQPNALHAPVPIYTHPNSMVRQLLIDVPTSQQRIYYPEDTLHLGPFTLTFCRTVHPVECYAVRIEESSTQEVLVFTADSGWCEELIPFAQGAHLLLADAAFENEVGRNGIHFTAEEVSLLANSAAVHHVVATHIMPQADTGKILSQIRSSLKPGIPLTLCQPGEIYEVKGDC